MLKNFTIERKFCGTTVTVWVDNMAHDTKRAMVSVVHKGRIVASGDIEHSRFSCSPVGLIPENVEHWLSQEVEVEDGTMSRLEYFHYRERTKEAA